MPEVSDIISGQTGTSRKIHKGPCFDLRTPVSAVKWFIRRFGSNSKNVHL